MFPCAKSTCFCTLLWHCWPAFKVKPPAEANDGKRMIDLIRCIFCRNRTQRGTNKAHYKYIRTNHSSWAEFEIVSELYRVVIFFFASWHYVRLFSHPDDDPKAENVEDDLDVFLQIPKATWCATQCFEALGKFAFCCWLCHKAARSGEENNEFRSISVFAAPWVGRDHPMGFKMVQISKFSHGSFPKTQKQFEFWKTNIKKMSEAPPVRHPFLEKRATSFVQPTACLVPFLQWAAVKIRWLPGTFRRWLRRR